MMNFEGKALKDEFKAAFGFDISEANVYQLRWLTKFAKHVRGRCRSNAAFNNYMNRNFAPARFKEVPKEWNGKQYMGLEITDGQENKSADDSESES